MHNESAAALTGHLTSEYGDVLPPGLIRTTVDVVGAAPHDPARPAYDEAVARADVAALADAAARAAAGGSRP